MVRTIKDIKAYSLSDIKALTTPRHENSRSVTLHSHNGLEVVLQATVTESGLIVPGRSPEQEHPHDELVYLLYGNNECYTRAGVELLAPNLLRIPPGVKHGGEANGVWISVKPKNYSLDVPSLSAGFMLYEGNGYIHVSYDIRENRRLEQRQLSDFEVIANAGPRKLKIDIGKMNIIQFRFKGL